jgi:quercetin dioxygenase-like cupin family protein
MSAIERRKLMGDDKEDIRGKILRSEELVSYQEGSIVSRTIVQKKTGTVTVFGFDKGQNLSEHTAPFDALISLLDGEAEITIGDTCHNLCAGDMIILPANVPHAVNAKKRFRMLLTMIRTE